MEILKRSQGLTAGGQEREDIILKKCICRFICLPNLNVPPAIGQPVGIMYQKARSSF